VQEISWALDRGGQSRKYQWWSAGKESFLGRQIGEVSTGRLRSEVVPVRQRRGTEGGPVVKPVGV
jgi:hypothetical protein